MPHQTATETDKKPAELFISYASQDLPRAQALHDRLIAAGFTVWFDKARLKPGYDWHKEISAGCEAAKIVLPLMTPNWRLSKWTKFETYWHRKVIPVLADGTRTTVLTPPLKHCHTATLDPLTADDAAWDRLFDAIHEKRADAEPERPPFLLRLPYQPNRHFTGREADMNRLHEELHAGPDSERTKSRVCALTALGGIGKTTLANEYVRRFWRLYPQILWVDVRLGYTAQFAAIFNQMFPDLAYTGIPDPDKAQRVRDVLREEHERLLVLDNVENEETAADWIPWEGDCRTLITSRFANFSDAIQTIPLQVLDKPAARAFLLSRTARAPGDPEEPTCDTLAARLGFLPLALEQAAAYIAEQKIGFTEYLRRFQESTADRLNFKVPGSTRYSETVMTTWRVTMQKLSPEAAAVLRLCAAMAPTPVPLEMLLEGAADIFASIPDPRPRNLLRSLFAPKRPPNPTEAIRSAVIEQLHRHSMIHDWTGEAFRVHPLVQEVEWVVLDKPARTAVTNLAATLLTAYAPPDPVERLNRDACDAVLSHGAALRARLGLTEDARVWPDHRLPGLLARYAGARGDFVAAETYAMDYYETSLRQLGPIHRTTRDAAESVALNLLDKGDYRAAVPIFRVMLHAYEVQDGPEHPDTLNSLNNLAFCLQALGDAPAALPLHRRALEVRERVLGAEHPDTLTSVNNLAFCLQALGDAPVALPLYRRALDARERMLGPEHPATLGSVNNLALCLAARGDAAAALPLHRRALEARERVLGAEHPDTLQSVNNLAVCLQALGDAPAALPLYRRALEGRERVLGAEHPDTLTSVNNLAACLETLGDAPAALPLYRRALEARERMLGVDHPNTLSSVNNLASCLQALGDAPAALLLYRRALEARECVLGAEHPDTLLSVNNLAHCLETLGDAPAALPLHRRALAARQRVLGAEHPDTLQSVNNLAVCLQALGDAPAARPLYRRALEGRERVLGAEHPDTLQSVNNLAHCLETLGDAPAALPLYRRALDGFVRLFGPDHPTSKIVRSNYERVLAMVNTASAAPPAITPPALASPVAQPEWTYGQSGISYTINLQPFAAPTETQAPKPNNGPL